MVFNRDLVSSNRSMPPGTFIPTFAYADVREAAEWLCTGFQFKERLRIGNHRAQLVFGDGSMVVTARPAPKDGLPASSPSMQSVMVHVENVDEHHAWASQHGAKILTPPTDHVFGERQYVAQDIGGHAWTFSQSIADIDPESWGGELLED